MLNVDKNSNWGGVGIWLSDLRAEMTLIVGLETYLN